MLVAGVALTDHLVHWQGLGFVPRALIDEPCHLATAFVVLGAFTRWRGRAPSPRFAWTMMCASVLIDMDHLPLAFGYTAWTAGTPRPYTHALWVVALLALAAAAAARVAAAGLTRSRAAVEILAGAACGVSAHFLRDVATAPIALWWPVSSVGVQIPYSWYLVALLILAVTPLPRSAGRGGRGASAEHSSVPRIGQQEASADRW